MIVVVQARITRAATRMAGSQVSGGLLAPSVQSGEATEVSRGRQRETLTFGRVPMNLLGDFVDIEFPQRTGIVYVLYFTESKGTPVPFYVGQSERGIYRFSDYLSGHFKAPTDFRVKEGILYLRCRGLSIRVKHKESPNRTAEEQTIISRLHSKRFHLLNDLSSYKYREADEAAERNRVHRFIEENIYRPTKGVTKH